MPGGLPLVCPLADTVQVVPGVPMPACRGRRTPIGGITSLLKDDHIQRRNHLGKVHPGLPVVRAVLHAILGRTEPPDGCAHDATAHGVVAAILDAQHRAPLLQEGVTLRLEHARARAGAANATMQADHIDTTLRDALPRGLTRAAAWASGVTAPCCHVWPASVLLTAHTPSCMPT
jgi:hypothetical protein